MYRDRKSNSRNTNIIEGTFLLADRQLSNILSCGYFFVKISNGRIFKCSVTNLFSMKNQWTRIVKETVVTPISSKKHFCEQTVRFQLLITRGGSVMVRNARILVFSWPHHYSEWSHYCQRGLGHSSWSSTLWHRCGAGEHGARKTPFSEKNLFKIEQS